MTVGGGVTTRLQYDGADLIAEYNASNALQRRYVHGPGTDNPIVWYEGSAISNATRRFLMADERGSVVSVTDSAGATVNINAYDEYGIPAPGNLGRFGYTGQTWLPELGMWSYKARMCSPTLGRFMQTDPIGYNDGMNWYNYVGSDPVNASDPTGLGDQKTRRLINSKKPIVLAPPETLQEIIDPKTIVVEANKPISIPGSYVVRAGAGSMGGGEGGSGGGGPQKNCGGLPGRGVLVEAKMIGANLPLSGGQFSGTATDTQTGKSVDISATYFGAGLIVGASFDVSLTIYDFASFSKTGGEFRFAAASAGSLGNAGGKFNLVDLDGNVIGKGSAELLNVSAGNLTFPIAAAGFEILPPSCN